MYSLSDSEWHSAMVRRVVLVTVDGLPADASSNLCNQRRGLITLHLSTFVEREAEWANRSELVPAIERVDQSLGILTSLSGALSSDTMLVVVNRSEHWVGKAICCARAISPSSILMANLADLSATILWTLGISIPPGYTGTPLTTICRPARDAAWDRLASYEPGIVHRQA